MEQYNALAEYYDKVITEKDRTAPFVRKAILRHMKEAVTVLELGCGTGEVLSGLVKHYRVSGIDSSGEMLRIARRKLPGTTLIKGDIRKCRLDSGFDAVICVYDTINHLTLFSEWKKVFANAASMLNEKGLFIFDVNTCYKLMMMERISPLVHCFDGSYLIMDVKKRSRDVYNWNLKVFSRKSGNMYALTESDIREACFDLHRILPALSQKFDVLSIEEEDGRKVNEETERIYFICRKKQ